MDTPASEKTHIDFSSADLVAVACKRERLSKEEEELRPSASSARIVDPPAEDTYPEGGRGWLVVIGCVMFAASTLGWALAWGVLQTYYQQYLFPDASGTILSLLGSLSGMVMTLGSMFTGKLGDRYGYKPFLVIGALFWLAGTLCSAFCTELWQFFITQGVLQGIANAFIFPLVVALPSQWFLKYRAFATGIVVAGCSLGGAVATLLSYKLLAVVGLRKTLLIYTGMDVVTFIVALMLIKERRHPSKRLEIIWIDSTFFKDPVFWSLGSCFLLTVFGYLTPIFFLPTYTSDKLPHLTDFLSTLPLTLLNLSAATGRTSVGFIADRIGPVNALWISIMLSGLAQLLIWNFVDNYPGIIVFGIVYGFFCGCFISLSPAVAAQLYGSGRLAGLSGLLLFFNLPGNAVGAPIGGAILQSTGNNWHAVACYSGCMQVVGGLLLLYARFRREPKLIAIY